MYQEDGVDHAGMVAVVVLFHLPTTGLGSVNPSCGDPMPHWMAAPQSRRSAGALAGSCALFPETDFVLRAALVFLTAASRSPRAGPTRKGFRAPVDERT